MKKVLITAPLSPLGKLFVKYYGERGDFLFLHYRGTHHSSVDSILSKYRGEGFHFEFKMNNIEEWIVEISFIEPDVLINNFGPFIYKNWKDQTYYEWKEIIEYNLLLTFFSTQKALELMSEKGYGRVINIGFHNLEKKDFYFPNVLPYAISKFGIRILTETLSRDIKEKNIKINLISPEYVKGVKPDPMSKPVSEKTLFPILDEIMGEKDVSGKHYIVKEE